MRTVLTIVASNSGSRTHKESIGTDLQFQGSVTAEVTAKGGRRVCRSFLGEEAYGTLG